MKTIRVLALNRALVAGLSLASIEGCNGILGNEDDAIVAGSGGTAQTVETEGGVGGTSEESTTADAGRAGSSRGSSEDGEATGGTGGTGGTGETAGTGTTGIGEAGATPGGAGQAGSSTGGSDGGSGAAPEEGGGGGVDGEIEIPLGPLAAPANVEFTPTGETAGTVAWKPVDEATSYTVEIATDAAFKENRKSASPTGTTTSFSGLNAGKRYYVRVRARGSQDRVSEWSDVASNVTLLNAPTPKLNLIVETKNPIRYPGGLWIEPPDTGPGQYYYAQGTASAECPAGTTAQYQFSANYDNGPRKNFTAPSTVNVAYIVAPLDRITYYVKARCVGPDRTSQDSPEVSACRRRDNSEC